MKLGWQIVCLNEVWYDHTVCVISFHPAVWCSGEMTLTAGIARETRCNLYVGAVDGWTWDEVSVCLRDVCAHMAERGSSQRAAIRPECWDTYSRVTGLCGAADSWKPLSYNFVMWSRGAAGSQLRIFKWVQTILTLTAFFVWVLKVWRRTLTKAFPFFSSLFLSKPFHGFAALCPPKEGS